MPTYSKVVSTLRQIDTIHTFIGGTREDITSAWTFVNGQRKQVFPSTEYYTEVYSKTTSGNYSETLPYGKYKVVISGGGGSGAILQRNDTSVHVYYVNNGNSGEEVTAYIDVLYGETKTFSGTIGTGASGSSVTDYTTATPGAAGTGYENGNKGNGAGGVSYGNAWGQCSGSGGGSSSLLIDGVVNTVAAGGNGGDVSSRYNGTRIGGKGGSGGTSSGTGAAGGAAKNLWKDNGTSGSGATGYIHIYKSNLYPN